MNKKYFGKGFLSALVFLLILSLTSCYSIFQGGASGVVVDGESTTAPKAGIANVDVYAYTSESARNSDFSSWVDGEDFTPKASYYGHTTTNTDGAFSISKLLWKSNKPAFGRDGDVTKIYLLFYHENYGLTKGDSLIVSDSMSNTVYQELVKTKIVTNLIISCVDVASNKNTTTPVFVSVSVPQSTEANPSRGDRTFSTVITGSGRLQVSYPRYKNADDKTNGVENLPEVSVKYYQNAQEETWKACFNNDSTQNFAFRDTKNDGIDMEIRSGDYSISLYGKATKLNMPVISGQLSTSDEALGTIADDGKNVSMKAIVNGIEIDCGCVTTRADNLGNGVQKHGVFSGLGQGVTFTDTEYTGKVVEIKASFFVDDEESAKKVQTFTTRETNPYVQL